MISGGGDMPTRIPLFLISILLINLNAGTAEEIPQLRLLSKHDIPNATDQATARDVRWASDGSLFLAYNRIGVFEFEIDEELKLVEEVFPPRTRAGSSSVRNLWNFASSKGFLLGAGLARDAGWRRVEKDSPISLWSVDGVLEDVDLEGEKVALLGHPGLVKFRESGFAFLWLGSLDSELSEWRPLKALSLPSSDHARATFSRAMGSLRFMPNGDLLAVPVVEPGVHLYSQSGKLESSWLPSELEASLLDARGDNPKAASEADAVIPATVAASKMADVNAHLESVRMVIEDVIPVGKSPALIARYRGGADAAFYLALLREPIEWYRLPFSDHPATVRVRADVLDRKGKLVALVTDRGTPSESTKAAIYVIELP
jgi:hypothetical protein